MDEVAERLLSQLERLVAAGEGMIPRLDKIEARLDRLDGAIVNLDARATLLVEIAHLHSRRFDDMDKRLDGMSKDIAEIKEALVSKPT